jgi:hypothetical protein
VKPQGVVVAAWLGMIGLTAARTLAQGRGLPQPSAFVASGVLFTLLYGGAAVVGPLAAVFAVGVDVAALALPYFRGGTTGPLDSIAAGLEKISGGSGTQSPAPGGGSTGNLAPGP